MHTEQITFIKNLKITFPHYFNNCKVLEIGSHNINGSIRPFFTHCEYIGIDVGEGDGVDIVCSGHEYKGLDNSFDMTISTECFEHNPFWFETFLNMIRMCKPGGMVAFTCAGEGRPEHGTARTQPLLTNEVGWGDYYRNLTKEDFKSRINCNEIFTRHGFIDSWYLDTFIRDEPMDLYFWGLKK